MKKIFKFVIMPIIAFLLITYVLNIVTGLITGVSLNLILKKKTYLGLNSTAWNEYLIWPFLLFVSILCARLLTKQKLKDLGFIKKRAIRYYIIGLILALIIMSITYFTNVFLKSITSSHLNYSFDVLIFGIISAFVFMFQGMAEEVVYRGIIFKTTSKYFKKIWFPILINAVLFVVAHGMNPGMGLIPRIQLIQFSIVCSFLMLNTKGSIWLVGAFHSFWNLFQFEYGSLVSGNNLPLSIVKNTYDESQTLLHGGAFGFEGGIIVNLILFIIIILMFINHFRIKGNYAV